MFKKDTIQSGIVLGLITPIVAMLLYYAITLGDKISLKEFYYYMRTNKSLLTGVSSISLIGNALLFSFFINRHFDKSAKGVFVITLIYGILVLLAKLIA